MFWLFIGYTKFFTKHIQHNIYFVELNSRLSSFQFAQEAKTHAWFKG